MDTQNPDPDPIHTKYSFNLTGQGVRAAERADQCGHRLRPVHGGREAAAAAEPGAGLGPRLQVPGQLLPEEDEAGQCVRGGEQVLGVPGGDCLFLCFVLLGNASVSSNFGSIYFVFVREGMLVKLDSCEY